MPGCRFRECTGRAPVYASALPSGRGDARAQIIPHLPGRNTPPIDEPLPSIGLIESYIDAERLPPQTMIFMSFARAEE